MVAASASTTAARSTAYGPLLLSHVLLDLDNTEHPTGMPSIVFGGGFGLLSTEVAGTTFAGSAAVEFSTISGKPAPVLEPVEALEHGARPEPGVDRVGSAVPVTGEVEGPRRYTASSPSRPLSRSRTKPRT